MANEHDIQVMLKLQSTLAASIKVEEEKVKASMGKMSDHAVSFGDMAKNAAGIAAGAFAAMKLVDITKQSLEMGATIDKTSTKLGMSAATFQKWAYIAKEGDADIGSLSKGFKELAAKAQANDPIFQKLTISTKEHNGELRQSSDMMADVIKRLSQIKNPTERLAVATKLLGKAAGDAMNLAALGAEKFSDLANESKKFTLSQSQLNSLDDANKSIERISMYFKVTNAEIVSTFAPAIEKAAGFMLQMAEGAKFIFGGEHAAKEKAAEIEMIGLSIKLTKEQIDELSKKDFNFGYQGLKLVNPQVTILNEKLKDLIKKQADIINGPKDVKKSGGGVGDLTDNSAAMEAAKKARQLDAVEFAKMVKSNAELGFKIKDVRVKAKQEELDELAQLAKEDAAIDKKLTIDRMNADINFQNDYKLAAMKKTEAGRRKLLDMQQKAELQDVKKHGGDLTAIEKEQAEERLRFAIAEAQQKVNTGAYYADMTIKSLETIAEATHANATVRKRIQQGAALVDGARAVMGGWSAASQLQPYPVMLAAGIASTVLIGAETAAQIAIIEQQKMAYGGVVTGGTAGQDSVPAMLMPGEIVYNPAHPNPALASIIGGSSTTNNNGNVNIHMSGAVVVQGSPSRYDLKLIQDHIDKGVTKALQKAQIMGKLNASGLVIRR
jgi:transposase-like protein